MSTSRALPLDDEEELRLLQRYVAATQQYNGADTVLPEAPGRKASAATTASGPSAAAAAPTAPTTATAVPAAARSPPAQSPPWGSNQPLPLYALPDQQYLELAIMPLLLRGLEELAIARPPDPLAFLGAYLLSNNPQRSRWHAAPSARPSSPTAAEETAAAPADEKKEGVSDGADGEEGAGKKGGNANGAFHGVLDRGAVTAMAAKALDPQ